MLKKNAIKTVLQEALELNILEIEINLSDLNIPKEPKKTMDKELKNSQGNYISPNKE